MYFAILGAAILITYFVWGGAQAGQPGLRHSAATPATSLQQGSLTIVSLLDGNLADDSIYRISPDPFTGSGNLTIHDGDVGRDSSSIAGIIAVEGMQDGAFSVIQVAGPEGEPRDIIPRVITITNGSSESVTFGTNPTNGAEDDADVNGLQDIESITYAAKFECGTIRGSEGPLRPGHYDTDIGIFNKQGFPLRVTWTAAANDNESSNALLKTLEPQASTSIVCNDIRQVIDAGTVFTEGFVIIEIPVDPRLIASISGGSSVLGSSDDGIDVLDVQIFYTANALEELPHSILVDKISFVIHSNNTVQSLPQAMIGTLLDITVPSEIGAISDPEQKVRAYFSANYNMTTEEAAAMIIEVRNTDVGVGTMIDDHAISLSKVKPQAIRS
jgi:hypothetical protein